MNRQGCMMATPSGRGQVLKSDDDRHHHQHHHHAIYDRDRQTLSFTSMSTFQKTTVYNLRLEHQLIGVIYQNWVKIMSLFQMVKGIRGKKYTEVRTQLWDSFRKCFKFFMSKIGQDTFQRRILKMHSKVSFKIQNRKDSRSKNAQ